MVKREDLEILKYNSEYNRVEGEFLLDMVKQLTELSQANKQVAELMEPYSDNPEIQPISKANNSISDIYTHLIEEYQGYAEKRMKSVEVFDKTIKRLEDFNANVTTELEKKLDDPRVVEFMEKYPEYTRTNLGPDD